MIWNLYASYREVVRTADSPQPCTSAVSNTDTHVLTLNLMLLCSLSGAKRERKNGRVKSCYAGKGLLQLLLPRNQHASLFPGTTL